MGEDENSKPTIVGYALKFDRPSEDLGFTEYIDPRSLDSADMSNVVALLNHDSNYVLGRTGRNLELEVDDIGLRFKLELNDTTYARDLIENMRNGLIDKCSFAFTVEDDEWEERDGRYNRFIRKIDKLYDVSVVTTPAYSDTEAVLSARTKDLASKAANSERDRAVLIMEMERNYK